MSSRKRSRDADEEKSRYFGVYPHGMREVALYELQHHCHATVIDEYPEVNAVIFGDAKELRAVGCYYTLFIYTDTRTLTEPTIKDVREALTAMSGLDGALVEGYRSWRVTGYRLEGTDGVVHEFNTMDLEKATADCIGSDTPVDLSGNADVEVVVWVMGLRIVVGWRPKRGWDKVDASRAMSISKEGRASRAPDAVSFCVGHLALMHHHHHHDKGDGTMVVSDPMCGVGSYLFAMYFILVVRGRSDGPVEFYGYDADEEAIAIARANAARLAWDINFEVLDCGEAVGAKGADGLTGGSPPIKADLVLVDPPWGHRHLTHSMVRKLYPRWSRSWLSLLKDESSLCVVVTIRTSHMQKEVLQLHASYMHHQPPLQILPHLTYRVPNFTQVGSPVRFDNMGFGQCAAFLWALHPPT